MSYRSTTLPEISYFSSLFKKIERHQNYFDTATVLIPVCLLTMSQELYNFARTQTD